MIVLGNGGLTAKINPFGAELVSLYHRPRHIEYLWSGDASFWNKHSPVLFPIVGALKDGCYMYQGNPYFLSRHGFARQMWFEVEVKSKSEATFILRATKETKMVYPFDFILKLSYSLSPSQLSVTYQVINPANKKLYFSIGGHPAFALSAQDGVIYEDYYLEFEVPETLALQLSLDGLMTGTALPFLNHEKRIALKKELFYDDALVFKNPKSRSISLFNSETSAGFKFNYNDFPYIAIWSAKDSPFICLEPWYGIADCTSHDHDLTKKEGIICLEGYGCWKAAWSVEIQAGNGLSD
ncbi:MAG TPA: aldose 1-epimerase family protein [Mucilaginibacter sp.]|jgi:galactose mutarotase-like enzyme